MESLVHFHADILTKTRVMAPSCPSGRAKEILNRLSLMRVTKLKVWPSAVQALVTKLSRKSATSPDTKGDAAKDKQGSLHYTTLQLVNGGFQLHFGVDKAMFQMARQNGDLLRSLDKVRCLPKFIPRSFGRLRHSFRMTAPLSGSLPQ